MASELAEVCVMIRQTLSALCASAILSALLLAASQRLGPANATGDRWERLPLSGNIVDRRFARDD